MHRDLAALRRFGLQERGVGTGVGRDAVPMHGLLRSLVASGGLLSLSACTGAAGAQGAGDGGADVVMDRYSPTEVGAIDSATPSDASDPAPVFSADEWAALQALSLTRLPAPPADPTNRFADDPAAARLGQRI